MDHSFETVVTERDADPAGFLHKIFDQPQPPQVIWAGFKFMLGHNMTVFKMLEADPGYHAGLCLARKSAGTGCIMVFGKTDPKMGGAAKRR